MNSIYSSVGKTAANYEYKPTAPCFECPDRHPACHGSCEKYKAYCEELNAIKDKRKKTFLKLEKSVNFRRLYRRILYYRKTHGRWR